MFIHPRHERDRHMSNTGELGTKQILMDLHCCDGRKLGNRHKRVRLVRPFLGVLRAVQMRMI